MKVGRFTGAVDEDSVATLEAAELASLRTDCASPLTDPAKRAAAERAAVGGKRMTAEELWQVASYPGIARVDLLQKTGEDGCCFQSWGRIGGWEEVEKKQSGGRLTGGIYLRRRPRMVRRWEG